MSRLERLEEAEDLVIHILECAAESVNELKEVQAGMQERTEAFYMNCKNYYESLGKLKTILKEEIDSIPSNQTIARRPGIDQLAIANWEAKVVADNIHELIQ